MGTKIPCILFVHITRKEHLKKAFYLKRNNGTHCTTFPFNNFFFRARGRHTQKMGHDFSAGKISFSSRGYSFSPKKGEKWRGQSWIFDRRLKENPWSHNLWLSRNLLQFFAEEWTKRFPNFPKEEMCLLDERVLIFSSSEQVLSPLPLWGIILGRKWGHNALRIMFHCFRARGLSFKSLRSSVSLPEKKSSHWSCFCLKREMYR